MDTVLQIGQPPIDISVRRRKNARRLTLRLGADGVFLTMPMRTPMAEAKAFAIKQEPWLRDKLAKRPRPHSVQDTGLLPIFGHPRKIIQGTGRVCRLEDDMLHVPGPPERRTAKIKAFLKETARAKLTAASDHYSTKIGLPYSKITLRDTRSRWGSCTTDGRLMYSWRLVMAPFEVLDYVAAHEVAHLAEMNHSAQYWAIVARICPDYHAHRAWLRQNGAGLHQIHL